MPQWFFQFLWIQWKTALLRENPIANFVGFVKTSIDDVRILQRKYIKERVAITFG